MEQAGGVDDGASRVQALLAATAATLRVWAAPTATAESACPANVAADACYGLAGVVAWLRAAQPNMDSSPAGGDASIHAAPRSEAPPHSAVTPDVARLVAELRAAIERLAALGEALEAADPVAQHDAVQALGLAGAVLEEAHARLLRAGLAAPRPVDLLAP